MNTQSLWLDRPERKIRPKLGSNLEVDVAIVGGGITGLTAALLLKRQGKRVAVLERGRVGFAETGHTTSHLTEIIDTRFYDILSDFGQEAARQVAQVGRAAIDRIECLVRELDIEAGFARVPAYLYAETAAEKPDLTREASAARVAGVMSQLVETAPLPLANRGALQVPNQAQFDALAYVCGLADAVDGDGSFVFESSPVIDFRSGEPCEVSVGGPGGSSAVGARDVIFATNHPISTRFLLHTKIAAYRTYAIAGPIGADFPDGLFWDLQDPYHYTRAHRIGDRRYLIVGGEDHKTGHDRDAAGRFDRLKKYARERFGMHEFTHAWSGQVIEPVDGLPYIGPSPFQTHFYVATGFSGNGMTLGTAAGEILSEQILGRNHPASALFDPRRITPKASAREFIAENVDIPKCLIGDYLAPPEARTLEEIGRDEGKILKHEGSKVAVYRDSHGRCHGVSPICPHMACLVRWNGAEKTWDCPCHGSRFTTKGEVLNGPAVANLKVVDVGSS